MLLHACLQLPDPWRSEGVTLKRVLEVFQAVDKEHVPVPRTSRVARVLPQVRHALAHLHRRVHRRVEQLGEICLALLGVDERGVVYCDDLAEDLARIAECQWGTQSCVGRLRR